MPTKPLMSWTPGKYRWRKMVRGTWFTVCCSDLGLPREQWTKDGILEAANNWWRAKEAELRATHPHEPIARPLRARIQYATDNGLTEDAIDNTALLNEVLAAPQLSSDLRFRLHDHDEVWADRLSRPTTTPTKKNRTIAEALNDWLSLIRVNAKPSIVDPEIETAS